MEDQAACKYQSNDPDEQKQDAGSDLVHKTPFRPEDGPSYTGYFSDGNIIAQKCQTINKDIRKNIYRRITAAERGGLQGMMPYGGRTFFILRFYASSH